MIAKTLDLGDYGEGYAWELLVDEIVDDVEPAKACKHAEYLGTVEKPIYGGKTRSAHRHKVPRMVQSYNEGHCNLTLVCADCIVEALS